MYLQLPDDIYLDAGIFIGAAIAGSNHSEATRAFCREVVREKRRIYFSRIARYEFAHIAWSLANPNVRRRLPDEFINQYELRQWDESLFIRQRWINVMARNLDRLLAQFDEVFEVPIRSQHWQDALNIIAYNNLKSYDALHLATARSLQLTDFATCDNDFTDIDGINAILVRDGP